MAWRVEKFRRVKGNLKDVYVSVLFRMDSWDGGKSQIYV